MRAYFLLNSPNIFLWPLSFDYHFLVLKYCTRYLLLRRSQKFLGAIYLFLVSRSQLTIHEILFNRLFFFEGSLVEFLSYIVRTIYLLAGNPMILKPPPPLFLSSVAYP